MCVASGLSVHSWTEVGCIHKEETGSPAMLEWFIEVFESGPGCPFDDMNRCALTALSRFGAEMRAKLGPLVRDQGRHRHLRAGCGRS